MSNCIRLQTDVKCSILTNPAAAATALLLPFYGHHTGKPASAGTLSEKLEDFVAAKFYCPHALADGNPNIKFNTATQNKIKFRLC